MQEDLNKPSHISYKEYQKKINKRPNEGIVMFVSAFFILLLLFLGIAKQISPEVDVSIGDDNSIDSSSEQVVEKIGIDDRLKQLQEEDASQSQDEMFDKDLEEKVVIPDQDKLDAKNTDENIQENPITLNGKEENVEVHKDTKAPIKVAPTPQQITPIKVVVGYYATKEQADVAKGIILESGLQISPFVRKIGGAYTIQVGSFSTREKAQVLTNELLRNNYPAKIISE